MYFRNSLLGQTHLASSYGYSFLHLMDSNWQTLDCIMWLLYCRVTQRSSYCSRYILCEAQEGWILIPLFNFFEIQTLQAARIGLLGYQNPSWKMWGFSWAIHWNVCGCWSRIFSMLWMPQPGLSLVECARPLFIIWPGCLVGPKVAYVK
jgi:hypothetical protein